MLDGCLRLLAYRPAAPCFDLVRPQQCPLRLFEQLFAHHCQFRADPAGLVLGPEADENSAAIASLWKVTWRPIYLCHFPVIIAGCGYGSLCFPRLLVFCLS
jgi:hypothetical protein